MEKARLLAVAKRQKLEKKYFVMRVRGPERPPPMERQSGVKGVSWKKREGYWYVSAYVAKKRVCRGFTPKSDAPEEIERSRLAAIDCLRNLRKPKKLMVFWGCQLGPGQTHKFKPEEVEVLHLSQACLYKPSEGKNWVLVEERGRRKFAIACLEKGRAEHASLNLFYRAERCRFINTGESAVHLTGYFVPAGLIGEELAAYRRSRAPPLKRRRI